jgi:hypothetical protein
MKRAGAVLLALTCGLVIPPSVGQSSTLKLRQYMTAEEFRAAGLEKLSKAEFDSLEKWFNRHTVNVYRLAKGDVPGARSSGAGYAIENAVNDETFIINGNVFKAQTYCFNFNKGDRVVFADGSPLGACATAKLVNQRTGDVCEVWCE